jgi:hypothetical protein
MRAVEGQTRFGLVTHVRAASLPEMVKPMPMVKDGRKQPSGSPGWLGTARIEREKGNMGDPARRGTSLNTRGNE